MAAEHRLLLIPDFAFFFEVIRLPKIIDRRDIEQQVKCQFSIIAEDLTDLNNVFAGDMDSILTSKTATLDDAVAQYLDYTPDRRRQLRFGLNKLRVQTRFVSGHIGCA